jgi:hypothetical protein
MALPIAKIDVINQALMELGRLPVINEHDSQDAQLISAKLDVLLPLLMLCTTWNFGLGFVNSNTPLTTTLTPDFEYNYLLPFNFGRFFKWSTNSFPLYYEIMDGILMCNIKPVQYYYVLNNVSYSAIGASFYRALALFAASDTCMALTQNAALTTYLRGKYLEEKSNAILLNDMERDVVSTPYNDFDRQTYI